MQFRIDLEIYRGPLDLLLYLVRKHEVDVAHVAIAKITQQYLEYLEILQHLDINSVGDFIEMAGVLIELKSKMVLPQEAEVDETPLEDPREELVTQLLEYKKYKDAAAELEERSREWQQRYARMANDLPPREIDPGDQPIQSIELWDLVNSFGRVMHAAAAPKMHSVVYDETPIQTYMQRIHGYLVADGQVAFSEMFQPGMHKSAMIGVFLAILELVRHHRVIADQRDTHGEIFLVPGDGFCESLDTSNSDTYGQASSEPS